MPNYGKDTIGGSNEALAVDDKRACKFTAPSDIGGVDSISAYLNRTGTGSGYAIRGGIYTDNAGAPDALVANSAIEINANIARNAPAWYSVSYVTKPTLTPGAVYWLCVQAAKASVTYFATGAAGQEKDADDAYSDDLENPFGAVNNTHAHEQSIYVSYTAGVTHQLAGVSAGVSTTTGALAVDHPVAGLSAAVSGGTGALSVKHILAGISAGVSTTTGALSVEHILQGLVAGVSTATGNLTVPGQTVALAGVSGGVAAVSGATSLDLALQALVAALGTPSAALAVLHTLLGQSAGLSTTAGILIVQLALQALSQGVAAPSGILNLAYALSGVAAAVATPAGNLTVVGETAQTARRGLLTF